MRSSVGPRRSRSISRSLAALQVQPEPFGGAEIAGQSKPSLGYAHHLLGQYQQAIEHFQRSIAIKRELSNQHSLATDLDNLGNAYHAAGDCNAARDVWQEAVNILD